MLIRSKNSFNRNDFCYIKCIKLKRGIMNIGAVKILHSLFGQDSAQMAVSRNSHSSKLS